MARPLLAVLPLVALLALVAGPARADDVILIDGSVHQVKILEVKEDGIRVTFSPKSGGTVTMDVPVAKLDPHFFYHLRDQRIADDDAKGRLKLALWAFEAGMFSRAKLQVEKAAAIDPKLVQDIQEGKLPEIREGIAKRVLDSVEEDVKAGRLELAEQKLEALLTRMPDTEAGTQARDALKEVQAMAEAAEAKAKIDAQAKLAEEEKEAAEAREKLLEPVDKTLKSGKEYMTDGLVEDDVTKALELLKRALARGEEALKQLDRLDEKHGEDAELMKAVEERRLKTVAAMVKVHLHRADLYTWRGSLKNAQDEIAAARALDPENGDIASASQRVADAENDDAWGLHWQRARRAERMDGRFRPGVSPRAAFGGGGFRR